MRNGVGGAKTLESHRNPVVTTCMYLACTSQSPPKHMACSWLEGGFGWLWVAWSNPGPEPQGIFVRGGTGAETHLQSRPLDRRHTLEAGRVGPFLLATQ